MSGDYRFETDQAAMRRLLTGSTGPVVQHVTGTSRQLTNVAKVECPVDKGNLRARHEFAVDVEGREVVGTVGSSADYAAAVHDGHRVSHSVSHRGRRVKITGRVPGNPWLIRAATRLGLSVRRET